MNRFRFTIIPLFLLLIFPIFNPTVLYADVLYLKYNGVINAGTLAFFERSFDKAKEGNFNCIIIELDTPGGSAESMYKIVKLISSVKIPVVVYVYPSGASAASAGFFILIASDVAVVSPGTNIGAATPVAMGEGNVDKSMIRKVRNHAASQIRALAKLHNRNVDLAEKAVTVGASYSDSEAVSKNLVDFTVPTVEKLLEKLNGRIVKKGDKIYKLKTKNAKIVELQMNTKETFMKVIGHPNIVYILMMIGFYGIIFEVTHPGAVYPGVIGAICLIIAFLSSHIIPINIGGLILILLAFIMFFLETRVASYGILTAGGVVLLVIGSLMFVDTHDPSFKVSLEIIIPVVAFTIAFFIVVLSSLVSLRKKKVTTGVQGIMNLSAKVVEDIAPEGTVFVNGEYWKAISEKGEVILKGEKVKIVGVDGLILKVIKC